MICSSSHQLRLVLAFNGFLKTLFIPIWILSLSAVAAASPSGNSIRLCLDSENYPPYFFNDESGVGTRQEKGMIVDLIRLSAGYSGYSVEFFRKPWRRCLADIKSGLVDASGPVIWSKARELWAVFPKDTQNNVRQESALWSVQYRVFSRNDSALRWDGERFSGIRYGVAAPLGHISHKKLKAMGILPSSTFNVVEGMTMVSRGFLDGFVNESLSGQFLIEQLGLGEKLSLQATPFLSTELYLVFSSKFMAERSIAVEQIFETLATQGPAWNAQLLQRYMPEKSSIEAAEIP